MVESGDQCHGVVAGEREALTRLPGCIVGLNVATSVQRELAILSALAVRVALARRHASLRGSQ